MESRILSENLLYFFSILVHIKLMISVEFTHVNELWLREILPQFVKQLLGLHFKFLCIKSRETIIFHFEAMNNGKAAIRSLF